MSFVVPEYTRGEVNRAGQILSSSDAPTWRDFLWADRVFANWRGAHAYPINTFQSTLRIRLKQLNLDDWIVAQRLKRAPSIISKLVRFQSMQLARMQDIGGLRAIVPSLKAVRMLETRYRDNSLKHELTNSKDYIHEPKSDGYRGVHLVFRYRNPSAEAYNGLCLELQIRTKLQHAWATAVETMGTFLGQALKSGQGEPEWRSFFTKASAGIAVMERSKPVPGFVEKTAMEIFEEVADAEQKLNVLERLRHFAVATDKITQDPGQGAYHLVTLDASNRSVSIKPFPKSRLDEANLAYAAVESRTRSGEPVEAVLVSAGPIKGLRKAYPNYFLDTEVFTDQVKLMIEKVRKRSAKLKPIGKPPRTLF